MKARFTRYFVLISIFAVLTAVFAANTFAQADNPLDKKYDVLLLQKVDMDPKLEADYPTAAEEYRGSLLTDLREKKRFKEVEPGETKNAPGGLIVKSKVTSLRIVSGAARFWGGAFAGSSDMSIEVKLVDANTGNVLREKLLSSANNPYAAAWAFGSSDRSLPYDMGKIVSAYILAIIPEK
jgi:hypothetical protein